MENLKNQEYSFSSLMKGKRFKIPEYQRYYAWSEENYSDLWNDLKNTIISDMKNHSPSHYMGTIVVKKNSEIKGRLDDFQQYEIVDGQQRVTTLSILVKTLVEEIKSRGTEHKAIEDIEKKYVKDKRFRDVTPQKLELQKEGVKDNKIFRRVMGTDNQVSVETPSQQRLLDCKKYFEDKVAEVDDEYLDKLLKSINKLQFMVYVVESDSKATLIFESINDRGKGLTKLEKTKSFLMHQTYLSVADEKNVQGKINTIKSNFSDIYTNIQEINNSELIDEIDEDALQRNHFVSFIEKSVFKTYLKDSDHHSHTRKTAGSNYLEVLKHHVNKLEDEDKKKCVEFIEDYCKDLNQFVSSFSKIIEKAEGDLQEAEKILLLEKYSNFVPLMVRGYQKTDREGFKQFLEVIEKALFRIYVVGNKRSNTGRNQFYRYAYELHSDKSSIDAVINKLVREIESYEDDEELENDIRSDSFYKDLTQSEIRYIFYFFDKSHKEDERSNDLSIKLKEVVKNENEYSIDHIWPQNPEKYGFTEETDSEEAQNWRDYRHTIGNLTITTRPRNSSWHNNLFKDKREDYEDSDFRVTREIVSKYASGENWTKESIEKRLDDIVVFVKNKWSVREHKSEK